MAPAAPILPRLSRPGRPSLRLARAQRLALEAFRDKCSRGRYPTAPRPCLCGGGEDIAVAGRDRYGLPLETVLCRRCGLMRSDPYFTPDALVRFYREDYRAIYSMHVGVAGVFAEEAQAGEALHRWLHGRLGLDVSRVLEIGCGAGGTLAAFRDQGSTVAGCDYDLPYLDYGRARGLPLATGDLETLRASGPASLLVLRHVLEHLPDPVAELRRMAALLGPGGCVCLQLPGIFTIRRTYGDVCLFLQNAHVWHFGLATLDFTMSRAGFVRIAGDEEVRAVYRHAPGTPPLDPDAAAHARVLEELVRLEHARYLRQWVALRQATVRLVVRLLGEDVFTRLRSRFRPT